MSTPSVAIIIPTLDSAATLEQCLRGVANLNWPREDLDLLVIDGGSHDETLHLVRPHPARLFVRAGTDAAFRRNFGAGQTDAVTLFLLDPDCCPPRDWVGDSLRHLKFAQVAAVGVRPVPPAGEGSSWVQRAWAARCLARARDARAPRLGARMLAVRREEFVAAGGFAETYGTLACRELLRRLIGPPGSGRRLMALTRPDGVRVNAGRGLRDFYRAQRRLSEATLSDGCRLGLTFGDSPQILLPIYGLLATFYLLMTVLWHALGRRPPGLEIAIAAALALGPGVLPALAVALRARRPGLFAPLWFLNVVRLAARGAALR